MNHGMRSCLGTKTACSYLWALIAMGRKDPPAANPKPVVLGVVRSKGTTDACKFRPMPVEGRLARENSMSKKERQEFEERNRMSSYECDTYRAGKFAEFRKGMGWPELPPPKVRRIQ